MPTKIVELELNSPLPSEISLPAGVTGFLALVRRYGRPVGLIRLGQLADRVTKMQLQEAITGQIGVGAEIGPPVRESFQPISIVVCSHERPHDLERCLQALVPLAAAGHEVIVVDNAPYSQDTAKVAARYPVRYLCEPKIGLDNARNCGLRAASHSIIAYTDDDTVPDPNWAEAIVQPFTDPAVACVTGLVMPLELETPAQEQFEVYCQHRRTFEKKEFIAPQTPPSTAGVVGMGANMAIRRDLAVHLGGFDPYLDGGMATCSGGDTDMFARILASGAKIVYTPEALVWHRHRLEMAELRACIFGYGVGLYAMLWKRLIETGDQRALLTAMRWLIGPPIKAFWHWLCGRPATSPTLLLLELWGALHGPLRYYTTRRQGRPTVTPKEISVL